MLTWQYGTTRGTYVLELVSGDLFPVVTDG